MDSGFNVDGTVVHIFDEKRINENFKIREFVVMTGESTPYPQPVTFQATNDNVFKLLDIYKGDMVRVAFSLRGKYGARPANGGNHLPFTKLEAWYIKKL